MVNHKNKSQVEYIDIGQLKPYNRNARTHSDEQVTQLSDSITEFGFTNPILVNDDNMIIAGHGRLLAAKTLGMKTVPCIRLSHLTDAQVKAYIIADNKLALNAGWDEDLLAIELGQLRDDYGYDLNLTGFSEEELNNLFLDDDLEKEGLTDDDDIPRVQDLAITQTGDIWQLGNHRLMCGDSTNQDHVNQLLGQKEGSCDCCWIDPPYNVDYEGKTADKLKIKNDKLDAVQFSIFITQAYQSAFKALKPGAPIYVSHADTDGFTFRSCFIDAGFKLSSCLIWVKNVMVLGRSDYQWKHEPILYGWKPGHAHYWYGNRNKTTVLESTVLLPLVQLPDGTIQLELDGRSVIITGDNMMIEEKMGSVFRCDKPVRSKEHPTMKPVSLILSMLKNSTKSGNSVLDLFGGSGSTLIACEKINRQSKVMELDPVFCDVIIRRWQEFTGKDAIRIRDSKAFNGIENEK